MNTKQSDITDLWEKHFGNVARVNLKDKRVAGFFEELNQRCIKEQESLERLKSN